MADHVRLFLTQNDLGIYADRFIEEGFDNMTSVYIYIYIYIFFFYIYFI